MVSREGMYIKGCIVAINNRKQKQAKQLDEVLGWGGGSIQKRKKLLKEVRGQK